MRLYSGKAILLQGVYMNLEDRLNDRLVYVCTSTEDFDEFTDEMVTGLHDTGYMVKIHSVVEK